MRAEREKKERQREGESIALLLSQICGIRGKISLLAEASNAGVRSLKVFITQACNTIFFLSASIMCALVI